MGGAIAASGFVSVANTFGAAEEDRGEAEALFDCTPLEAACFTSFTSCVPAARVALLFVGAGEPKPFVKAFGGAGAPKGWAIWFPKPKLDCGAFEGCVAGVD